MHRIIFSVITVIFYPVSVTVTRTPVSWHTLMADRRQFSRTSCEAAVALISDSDSDSQRDSQSLHIKGEFASPSVCFREAVFYTASLVLKTRFGEVAYPRFSESLERNRVFLLYIIMIIFAIVIWSCFVLSAIICYLVTWMVDQCIAAEVEVVA